MQNFYPQSRPASEVRVKGYGVEDGSESGSEIESGAVKKKQKIAGSSGRPMGPEYKPEHDVEGPRGREERVSMSQPPSQWLSTIIDDSKGGASLSASLDKIPNNQASQWDMDRGGSDNDSDSGSVEGSSDFEADLASFEAGLINFFDNHTNQGNPSDLDRNTPDSSNPAANVGMSGDRNIRRVQRSSNITTPNKLEQPARIVHQRLRRSFACDECHSAFPTEAGLSFHWNAVHSDDVIDRDEHGFSDDFRADPGSRLSALEDMAFQLGNLRFDPLKLGRGATIRNVEAEQELVLAGTVTLSGQ